MYICDGHGVAAVMQSQNVLLDDNFLAAFLLTLAYPEHTKYCRVSWASGFPLPPSPRGLEF